MDIQSQIDDLFSPTPEVVEEPQQEVIEEQVKKIKYERVTLSDDIFSDISETDITDLTEALTETSVEVQEAIDIKKADMGEVIKDFRQSDAPQFKGKSKKKKQQMAIAAKLNTESYEERLMNTVMSQITKNAKNENLQLKEVPELNEERIKNIETQLIQVRQLFHEATMVSGIGQGGDGQTPGSGEVRLARLDDVDLEGIAHGDTIIWDSVGGNFVPGSGGAGGATQFGVDRIIAGTGIDIDPVGGIGSVEIIVDLALEELRNVNGTPTNGDLLIYDNGDWDVGKLKDEDIVISDPDSINDAGNVLDQAGANAYFGSTLEGHEDRIDALENATIPGTFLGVIDATDPLNEPTDTSVLNKGDYYIHDGATGTLWGSTEPDAETIEDGNQIIWDGTNWMVVSTVSTLAQLGDTDVDSAGTGDFLVYDDGTGIWSAETVDIPNVTVGPIQPNTGEEQEGDFWYDNDNGILYIYDSVWVVAGSDNAGANVQISALPPDTPAPEEGDLWVSDDNWALYIFDGNNWVALTNNGLVGGDSGTGFITGAELNATVDTLTYNTTEVQNNLNAAVVALDATHLRIVPQKPLEGPLLLSNDGITNQKQATTKEYVDNNNNFIKVAGQTDLDPQVFKIRQPNSDGKFRSFINIHNGDMNLYNVVNPSGSGHEKWAANKEYVDTTVATSLTDYATETYVDDAVAAIPTPSGVPVGSIMIWMNSSPPPGWFKLQGGTFDVNQYPQLHAYLQNTGAYTTGTLPNWSGYFPGEWGDSNGTGSLGTKQGYRTAEPTGGQLKSSSNTIPTGATRTFTATGNTNAYSAGQARLTIRSDEWDDVTRPNTILVHYIIKHD